MAVWLNSSKLHTEVALQGSPSGCARREIPGVTQLDEKGHEGNTAAVTAYIIYVGGNMEYIFHEE